LHLLKPNPQRLAVAQHLFGSWTGKRLGQHIILEQLVVRGDDVLDLRTVFCLLQAQGVDQDALIGNRRRYALQLRQLAATASQLFKNGRCLEPSGVELIKWRKCRHGETERAEMYNDQRIFCMLNAICIEK